MRKLYIKIQKNKRNVKGKSRNINVIIAINETRTFWIATK